MKMKIYKFFLIGAILFLSNLLCSFTYSKDNSGNLNILNYRDEYWGNKMEYVEYKEYDVLDDDEIVNLIPKEYFFKVCSLANPIDCDSAYFISTRKYRNENGIDLYLSDVMLISVENHFDINNIDHPSQVIQTIKPIFQAMYLSFSNNVDVYYDTYWIHNESELDDVVTPAPSSSKGVDDSILFEIDDYYMTNIEFKATLLNERHKNSFDNGYISSEDQESFFVRSDIYYNGLGKINSESAISIIKSCIGFIPITPSISVGDIISFVDFAEDTVNIISQETIREEALSNEINKNIVYASANEQIENYGGLVKYLSNSLISDEGSPLLISSNGENYVTNKYTLSTRLDWETYINTAISFDVVSVYDDWASCTVYSEASLRDEEPKSINGIEFITQGYHIPNCNDSYVFIPKVTAYYSIVADNNLINIYSDSIDVIKNNDYYLLEKDKKYIIDFSSDSHGIFNIKFEIMSFEKCDFYIPDNKEVCFKVDINESDLYNLQTSNDTTVTVYSDLLEIVENFDTRATLLLKKGIYYFNIKNSKVLIPKLSFIETPILDLGEGYDGIVNGDLYFKFIAPNNGYYYVTEFKGNSLNIYSKDNNFIKDYVLSSSNKCNRYRLYLNAGENIYIGYNNLDGKEVSFNILNTEEYVEWYSDGDIIENNLLVLKQNTSTIISAKIGNVDATKNLDITALAAKGIEFNAITGELNIYHTAIPTAVTDGPYHLLTIFNDDVYSLNIYVIVDFNLSVSYRESTGSMTSSMQNGININLTAANSNDLFEMNFKITFNDGSYIYKIISLHGNQNGSIILYNSDLLSNYNSSLGIVSSAIGRKKATFSLDNIKYKQYDGSSVIRELIIYNSVHNTVSNNESSFRLNDYTICSMFTSGYGTSSDPFIITNEHQFNNIRYMLSEFREGTSTYYYVSSYFELQGYISFSSNFSSLPILRNSHINGNGSTLSFSNNSVPVFSEVRYSNIENLSIRNIYISSYVSNEIGCLANKTISSTLENVSIYNSNIDMKNKSDIIDSNKCNGYSGGLVGYADSSIFINCSFSGNIITNMNIGGIVGYAILSTFDGCQFFGKAVLMYDNINLTNSIGGICGITYSGTVRNCFDISGSLVAFSNNDRDTSNDKNLKPRGGYIVGTSKGNTIFLNNDYEKGQFDSGTLRSWWEWFVTYNQLEFFNGSECGKVE